MNRRTQILTAIGIAAGAFGLGALLTRTDARAPLDPEGSAGLASGRPWMELDASAPAPRILIDPSSITLLPDASLHLELPSPPRGPDGGDLRGSEAGSMR